MAGQEREPDPPNRSLWAPWRMKYLKQPQPEGCFLCQKAAEDRDQENLILLRGQRSYLLLNLYPYAHAHLMVAPYQHRGRLEEMDVETLAEMMQIGQRALRALGRCFKPEGFNLGINQGRAAGAGVDDHLHLHIVPRWLGDTNFMALLGGVRTIPQSLEESYRQLRQALEEE